MTLGKREKIAIGASITIVGGYLLYAFMYNPLIKNLKILKQDYESLQKEMKALSSVKLPGAIPELGLEIVEGEYRVLEEKLNSIEVVLPREDQVSLVLAKITDLADSSKVELIFCKRQSIIEGQAYKKLPIELVLSCPHADLVKFIEALDSLSWLTLIDDIDIRTAAGNIPNLDVRLTLNIYLSEAGTK